MRNLEAGYGLDQDGYIVSDVSLEKINDAYSPCIQESVQSLVKLFPHRLHSVYVYGSVARGEALPVQSDLDILGMFHGPLNPEEAAALKTLTDTLSQNYRSLVRDVGIEVANYDEAFNPANYYEQAFLKELCVCVHGVDLRERFGPYKLISDIALSFNGDICDVLPRTISRIEMASHEEFKSLSQKCARKLIRTYYSMVMARSQIWTTRLHEQSEVFIRYFPDKEPIIRTLQKWIVEPPMSRDPVLEFLHSEDEWLRTNFEHEARLSS